MDFDEFMTILGPKLLSSETRDGFLGNTIDSIFWQVCPDYCLLHNGFLIFFVFSICAKILDKLTTRKSSVSAHSIGASKV